MNKDELVEKVKQLSDLTNDEKAELIAGLRKKKYGLVWENHPEAVEERLRTQLPVLVEETSKALTDGGEDAPNHILIEGDNLDALTALTYTHEGKVDVIYIDPPYNTGNKDFVYNDSFVDSEDGYRHSKWLSFMEKRLRIAKKLLSDRGVIFISIDDNEQANLGLLCNDIFGEKNRISCISIINNLKGRSDDNFFATCNEFLWVYAKNKPEVSINGFFLEDEELDKDYDKQDAFGCYKLIGLRKTGTGWERHNRPYMFYPIIEKLGRFNTLPNEELSLIYNDNSKTFNDDYVLSLTQKYESLGFRVFWPKTESGVWGRWRWGVDTFNKQKDLNVELNNANTVCSKMRAILEDGTMRMKSAKTVWYKPEYDNGGSSKMVNQMFGQTSDVFSNPKSVFLIKDVFTVSTDSESLILDFFAGSGTTLHATMQLNKEDGGHRKCILVTNNENNICEEVTYERNKRVINGYTTPKGEKVEGLHGNNLRYYKVDFVERDSSLEGMRKLMEASTDLLCIKHDLYHEEHTFGNLKLRPHIARYFADETGRKMLIIYKVDAIEYFVKEIAQMPEGTQIMVYVFSTNNYAMDADFEEVADKVTLCALPATIYNAYLKVLPKKKMPVGADVEQEEPTLFNGEEDEQ